jgi:hypothetical protein
MFGCVTWDRDSGDESAIKVLILDAVPDPKRACYFMSSTVLFAVGNMSQLIATRGKLKDIQLKHAGFAYSVTVHDDLSTFGGRARYRLTDEVRKAMGLV